VIVFDAGSGRLRFRVEMEPRTLYHKPFVIDHDKLFLAHGTHRFECWELATGRKLWESRLPDERFFKAAIPTPAGILFTDTKDFLMLLDTATGKLKWTVPPVPNSLLQFEGEAADREHVYVMRRKDPENAYLAEARDLATGEIVWRTELIRTKSATPEPIVTDRYIAYHLNSYDFGQSAWMSRTLFLDKHTGKIAQEIAPEMLQGFFTYAYVTGGLFALNARGRLAVFGPK
jgi:outer membrane protein assembly factor BamB